MSGGNLDWTRSLPVTGALSPWLLVVDNGSGQWVYAGQGQAAEAVFKNQIDATGAALTPAFIGSGELLMRGKIRNMTASGAISAYATVYTDASGQITSTPYGYRVGKALESASGAGSVISVEMDPGWPPVANFLAAPTASFVGITAEAVMATFTMPAGTLAIGDCFTGRLLGVGSGHTTDTTQVRVRLGGLTGTVIADTTAVASVSAATPFSLDFSFCVQGPLTSGCEIDGGSEGGYFKANVAPISAGQINLSPLGAITCVATIVHGSSSSGNSTLLNEFTILRGKAG